MKICIIGFWFIEHVMELSNGLCKNDEIFSIIPNRFIKEFGHEFDKKVKLFPINYNKIYYNPINIK